jgi:hypothetical protein
MAAEPGERLFAGLPAVFRSRDGNQHLARLLGVFEALLFEPSNPGEAGLPGIERQLPLIPALFAPLGTSCNGALTQTPERFLNWLAAALAFTPHALFGPAALRRISAGIVPLYGLRGTRDYLLKLLALCFEGEVAGIHVDDRPRVGLTIGESVIGRDTRLATRRPFWFKVVVELNERAATRPGSPATSALEKRLRTVIDFAKPAHTAYELHLGVKPEPKPAADDAPIGQERDG